MGFVKTSRQAYTPIARIRGPCGSENAEAMRSREIQNPQWPKDGISQLKSGCKTGDSGQIKCRRRP